MAQGEDADDTARGPVATPRDTASYIAELTTELAGLARASKLDFLANLLDMSQLEAAAVAKRLAAAKRR